MALVHYEPRDMISRLQNEINRLFEIDYEIEPSTDVLSDWVPAVDILEYEDHFALSVDLPGVSQDQVELTLENNVLTISGQREKQVSESNNPVRQRAERGSGRFFRRFILPRTIDQDKVKAGHRDGVLEINIPKQAKAQPRRIKIAA